MLICYYKPTISLLGTGLRNLFSINLHILRRVLDISVCRFSGPCLGLWVIILDISLYGFYNVSISSSLLLFLSSFPFLPLPFQSLSPHLSSLSPFPFFPFLFLPSPPSSPFLLYTFFFSLFSFFLPSFSPYSFRHWGQKILYLPHELSLRLYTFFNII